MRNITVNFYLKVQKMDRTQFITVKIQILVRKNFNCNFTVKKHVKLQLDLPFYIENL